MTEPNATETSHKAFLIRLPVSTLKAMEDKARDMHMPTSALIRALCIELETGKQIIVREQPTQAAPQ